MPERVAVVIPCYNHARYVGEALESVLRQTRAPDRIIVIDDGSKDDSVEVLRSFASRGVEVYSQENRGAHNTINKLVELASQDCRWVSILNSDDRYLPQRIETLLRVAQELPGKSVISTSLRVIDQEGNIMPPDAPRARWFHGAWTLGAQDGVGVPEWLGQANFIATTTNVFARADYLRANPFRPYRFNHDYFLLATAALENRLEVLGDVLLEYRVHGANTISTRPEPLIREMLRMHLDLYRRHAAALRDSPEMRKRFYGFVRSSWDNISSFHAGMLQIALAQLATKCSEDELAALSNVLDGPEFDAFPNSHLSGAFDGVSPLTATGVLNKKVEELKEERDSLKADRESLDHLSRFRHKMLRSKWVRIGLLCGFCRSLVSNHGKKPHEKMLYLREKCMTHPWLWLGEKLGSSSCYELRRARV